MSDPSYFAIIPAKVRYDKKLTNSQKIMFGEITALSNKFGYCNASNKYFAELYNVDKSTVSKWITGLKGQGYIDIKYEREGKFIKSRKIRPLFDVKGIEINQYPIEYSQEGVLNKTQGGIELTPKSKTNNTSNNNTSNNNVEPDGTTISVESCGYKFEFEQSDFPKCVVYIDESIEIAIYLLESIVGYDNTHSYAHKKPSVKTWAKDIERAMRLEKRTSVQLEYLINAIYDSEAPLAWWRGNIESGRKLAEKFDTLKNQLKNKSKERDLADNNKIRKHANHN